VEEEAAALLLQEETLQVQPLAMAATEQHHQYQVRQ
jgi:hypothetical protein